MTSSGKDLLVSTEPISAAVDRIVDGIDTLLVDDDTQPDLAATLLPEGISDGDWVTINRSTDPPTIVADPERTEQRRSDLSARFNQLRNRSRRFNR